MSQKLLRRLFAPNRFDLWKMLILCIVACAGSGFMLQAAYGERFRFDALMVGLVGIWFVLLSQFGIMVEKRVSNVYRKLFSENQLASNQSSVDVHLPKESS